MIQRVLAVVMFVLWEWSLPMSALLLCACCTGHETGSEVNVEESKPVCMTDDISISLDSLLTSGHVVYCGEMCMARAS